MLGVSQRMMLSLRTVAFVKTVLLNTHIEASRPRSKKFLPVTVIKVEPDSGPHSGVIDSTVGVS